MTHLDVKPDKLNTQISSASVCASDYEEVWSNLGASDLLPDFISIYAIKTEIPSIAAVDRLADVQPASIGGNYASS